MPRVRVECECSWVFFIPIEQTGRTLACPSCEKDLFVPISSPEREPPPRLDRRVVLIAGFAAFVLVALGGLLLFGRRSPPRDDRPDPLAKRPDRPQFPSLPPTEKKPEPEPETDPTPEPPRKREDVWKDHQKIDETVYLLNIAGIVSEILRHRGDVDAVASVRARMRTWMKERDEALDRVTRNGESHFLSDFLRPGDRIEFFENLEVRDDAPAYAIEILGGFLAKQLRDGAFAECRILRDGLRRTLTMYWPWVPKDADALVRGAGVTASPSKGTDAAPAEAGKGPLPAALLALVRDRLAKVHDYYRLTLPPAERARLEDLLKTGEGYPDDEKFLRSRILVELVAEADAEMRSFLDQAAELETRALEVARVDVVHLKDGSKREGSIIEEKDDFVRLEVRSGQNRASVPIPRDQIAKIDRGQGAGARFPERLKDAGRDGNALAQLLQTCLEQKLAVQAQYVAWKLLAIDPAHAAARQHLGYQRDGSGLWSRAEEVVSVGGKFQFQGRPYTLEELERRLPSAGYVRLGNGLWYSKKPWTFIVENLYDLSGVKIAQERVGIVDLIDTTKDVVYDVSKMEWVPRDKRIVTGRCFGLRTGAQSEGRIRITVEAPGPIYRCRVTAPSKITAAEGWILVRVYGSESSGQTLYRLVGKGGNERSYDVSAAVVGSGTLVIEAQMRSAGHSPSDAMFLPCTKNDRETLKVSGETLVPADSINRWISSVRSPSPRVKEDSGADAEHIVRMIRDIAADVIETRPSFARMIADMQARTRGVLYRGPFQLPGEYVEVTGHILEPLSFRTELLGEDVQARLEKWWEAITADERRTFAHFFGLWCAVRRAGR